MSYAPVGRFPVWPVQSLSETIRVLAVSDAECAVVWEGGADVLYLGGAVAMVIVALTWFLSKIEGHSD